MKKSEVYAEIVWFIVLLNFVLNMPQKYRLYGFIGMALLYSILRIYESIKEDKNQ